MKRKNVTRNALFTSILSLLLCVSMLVGTTFAWFTDEVTSGMNTIAAGNLDVELYSGDTKVTEDTMLFSNVELWEPGVVCYENLQVKNVGTLALKYQLTLNFGDENDLEGHKLSEVLKIAVVNQIADGATRAEVLEAAKAAVEAGKGGALGEFKLEGELEPQTAAAAQTFVIFWEPNANEIDNLYNANNGKTVSDYDPTDPDSKNQLRIEFGINLQATQMMYEDDCFGTDYDKDANILPNATVKVLGPQTVKARLGLNGPAKEIVLNDSFQFLPNESLAQAQASPFRYWHADYVVSADKDIAPNTVGLAGYYQEWCSLINHEWVYLTNDETIPAGTEIRLVELLGTSVNYEEICQFGNDGVGFKCGVSDLTGDNPNAGTTITVQLRIYETEEPSDANGNSHNVETGNYQVVETRTYTFPTTP